MKVGNKRFIDSYLFIPVPLASFPTTFGLAELKKGHFPHLLSSPESLKDPPEQLHEPGSCQEGASCIQLLSYSEDCEHCIAVRDENAVGGIDQCTLRLSSKRKEEEQPGAFPKNFNF